MREKEKLPLIEVSLYGKEEVEQFLDAIHSIQKHINSSIIQTKLSYDDLEEELDEEAVVKKTVNQHLFPASYSIIILEEFWNNVLV